MLIELFSKERGEGRFVRRVKRKSSLVEIEFRGESRWVHLLALTCGLRIYRGALLGLERLERQASNLLGALIRILLRRSSRTLGTAY